MKMIKKLLEGKNEQAQIQLDILLNSIGDNPDILWYPSAGNDYRDIIELSPERAKQHGITELPDLFIHTDYDATFLNLTGTVFSDDRTTVRIINKFELQLIQRINYVVRDEFVTNPEVAPKRPTIYLLDVSISSNKLCELNKKVIYFLFENINFLNEIILKNNIPISHLVKVREGCGFGGNRKSISIVYAFLSALKTKYLLIDNEEHTDFELADVLKMKHKLTLLEYNLSKINSITGWSGFNVNIFTTSYGQKELGRKKFNQILNTISKVKRILRKPKAQKKSEKLILDKLRKLHFDSCNKRRPIVFSDYTDITIDNQTLTISICSKDGKNPIVENMQTDGTAFEGWAICLKSWLPDIKNVILKWEAPKVSLRNGHYKRFLFRVSNFEKMFSWFSYDIKHDQEIINFRKIFVNTFNNCGNVNPQRPVDLKEKRVEYDLVHEELNQKMMQKKFGITKINHQLPVGIKKDGRSFFTGGASAIDLWGITNDKTLKVFELKYIKNHESSGNKSKNIKVGILSELLFYVCVMYDIFNGHINKPVPILAEEISLYKTDIKNIKGYFFATEYHPLLENFNILKLLNNNSFGIEFEKYKYVFNSENNLLISIE